MRYLPLHWPLHPDAVPFGGSMTVSHMRMCETVDLRSVPGRVDCIRGESVPADGPDIIQHHPPAGGLESWTPAASFVSRFVAAAASAARLVRPVPSALALRTLTPTRYSGSCAGPSTARQV